MTVLLVCRCPPQDKRSREGGLRQTRRMPAPGIELFYSCS
ncbi:hypothetical protein C4K27_3630 [Pseudomonas chlororaphis subsp. chlororaphis]|nr:hypothetical protein C4K27_3630 [Pseudomonas chlororaphis subsp. chlororaphis]